MQEHEATSQSSHLYLLLGVLKEWKSSPGPNLGSAPMALEQNLSELQLQEAVEVTGDLEVDCYRAPCCESQEELALQHLLKEKLLAQLEEKLRVFANIVAVLNKEVEASHLALAASIHQSQLDREHVLNLEQRVSDIAVFSVSAQRAPLPSSLLTSHPSQSSCLHPRPSPLCTRTCY